MPTLSSVTRVCHPYISLYLPAQFFITAYISMSKSEKTLITFELFTIFDAVVKVLTRSLLWSLTRDFVGSAVLWRMFLGLLIFTQDQGILSTQQKYLFNVVVTGIPLLLGLQTVVCPLRVGSREVRLLIAEN